MTQTSRLAAWMAFLALAVLAGCVRGDTVQFSASSHLLNAYRSPLSALTAPGNYYFLEFPLEDKVNEGGPRCGDGSPFSFAFRRGSDKHVKKILIELEGGPACWNQDSTVDGACCSDDAAVQVPWYSYYTNSEKEDVHRAGVEKCTGVTPSFIKRGAQQIFRSNGEDLPLALRDVVADDLNPHQWWGVLGGESSNVKDWSYILIPHCTLDWHLGHQSTPQVNECNINDDRSIYHSGGTNLDAVVSWIEAQFPDGLEALVIASGGKLGGCDDTANTSTIATALLASKLSSYAKDSQSSDALVISEGSGLFDSNLPSPDDLATRWNSIDIPHGGSLLEGVEDWIQSSPESVKVAWLASPGGRAGDDEEALVGSLQMSKGPSFHILQAPPSRSNVACPVYAFPESSDSYVFGTFLRSIVQRLSWNDAPETAAEKSRAVAYSDGRNRLSFLTIFILVLAVLVLVWITYYVLKRKKSALLSPTDVWFLALTRYPLTFMVVSVAIPLSLAIAVYAKSGYQVPMNLDFDSYLEINTPLENVRRAYDDARALQRESLNVEIENCELIMSDDFQLPSAGRRYLFEDKSFTIEINHDMDLDNFDTHERELSLANMLYSSGGEAISVMYQNRNGGNVFEPEVLREIYEFEQSLYAFPGFGDYCFGFGRGRCVPIDSLVTHFFVNGEIVSDIEGIVRSFLGNQPALWKLDQNFGPDNLNSEVIRSFIFLNNVGGDQRAAHPFLESLYRDYFWKADQSNAYSHMIHTWDNAYLRDVEANDALRHDTLWSIGSLCFIALMVLLKVRSLFVVFFSMLGLVLAFAASYYWASIHFAIESPTLLWVAGLYVMLGIGADDIFLMVDSFEHTKIDFDANETSRCECATEDDKEAKLDVLRDRMQQAYRKAGGMMLVSSVTTAICFFSNAFGVLVVIQEFGIFMGLVVLVNFLHVMTILPSAILVNEFYVLPLRQRMISWYRQKFRSSSGELEHSDMAMNDSDRSIVEASSKMNRMDSWLVNRYSPLINRRALFVLIGSLLLAIILGVFGTLHFTTSDGNIVLFTEKYNLGRLAVVTDTYFNSDIKKTIEENPASSTTAPSSAPINAATPTNFAASSDEEVGGGGSSSLPESATEGGEPSNGEAASNGGGSNLLVGSDGTSSASDSSPPIDSTDSAVPPPTLSPTRPADVPGGSPTTPPGPAGSSAIGGGSTESSGAASGSSSGGSSEGSSPGPVQQPVSMPVAIATAAPVNSVPLGPNTGLDLRRRETIYVNLIWGVQPDEKTASLWRVNGESMSSREIGVPQSSFDLSDPTIQAALFETVQMARRNKDLDVQPDKPTWIEMLHDFAVDSDLGFPIPQQLFIGYVQLLKERNQEFASLVAGEIGTQSPGLAGDFTFVSVTLQADAVTTESVSLSETVYRKWSAFAAEANSLSPSVVPEMVAQSRIFLDAYRVEATIESTVATWFIANGLCFLVILLFTRNILLSFMVMATIILIFFCLGGIIFSMFKIPFGAVEALGISIFIGLSANYSLHVVHAYHHSRSDTRNAKVKEAVFAVGSPIVASAFSTMGASAFLFGCRTWVFVELGILVCSITAMALLYSMTFLLAWLAMTGPLPFEKNGDRVHSWDFRALCCCNVSWPWGSTNSDEVHDFRAKSQKTLRLESENSSAQSAEYQVALGDSLNREGGEDCASHSIAVIDRSTNTLNSAKDIDKSVNTIGDYSIAVIDRSVNTIDDYSIAVSDRSINSLASIDEI